jgi:hypothetical protein
MTTTINPRHALLILAALLAVSIAGCGEGYMLRGRVIRSETSYVALVDPSDPRLDDDTVQGIPGVTLHLQMDPGKLNRETITRDVSAPDGSFALRVPNFGAGWMEYDVGLFARKPGLTPAQHFFRLPPDSKRVIIMMAPGHDQSLGEDLDMGQDDYNRLR